MMGRPGGGRDRRDAGGFCLWVASAGDPRSAKDPRGWPGPVYKGRPVEAAVDSTHRACGQLQWITVWITVWLTARLAVARWMRRLAISLPEPRWRRPRSPRGAAAP